MRINTKHSRTLKSIIGNKPMLIGLVIIILYAVLALFAPFIAPENPTRMNFAHRMSPPNARFLLGTDEYGRDILSRILYGTQVSLYVAAGAASFALILGTPLGMISGLYGGIIDDALMRAMDVLFAFPPMLLALVIVAVLGQNAINIIIAIGIIYTPQFARVARSAVLVLKNLDFIEAAKALGVSKSRIWIRHMLPNAMTPIIVQYSLSLSLAVLVESALSFLGLGTQPPAPSLGSMLGENRHIMALAPWAVFFPGLAIMGLVLGFNFLGDGLRDVLDPRLRGGRR